MRGRARRTPGMGAKPTLCGRKRNVGSEDDFEACIAHLRLPVTHRRSTFTEFELRQIAAVRKDLDTVTLRR